MLAIRAPGDVTVDMRDLAFADLSLMIDLATLSQRLRRRDKALVLTGAQPQIMSLIECVGLDRLPGVRVKDCPSVPAAA